MGHDDDYSVTCDNRKYGNEVGEDPQVPQFGFFGQGHSRERTLTGGSKTCENRVSKFWGVFLPLVFQEKTSTRLLKTSRLDPRDT